MIGRTLCGHADESLSDTRRDPGTYILAAAICETTAQEQIRDAMQGLRLKGQRKVHWHDEDHKRRQAIIERVAELPLMHLVVVRDDMPDARPERRRRLCMERLLFELDQLEVGMVTFESRGPADDRRDRNMVSTMRAARTITSQLRIEHQKGPLDPLLWVPDAVCGALTADRLGDATYYAEITTHTQLITL